MQGEASTRLGFPDSVLVSILTISLLWTDDV
jgi:hypothetical protein